MDGHQRFENREVLGWLDPLGGPTRSTRPPALLPPRCRVMGKVVTAPLGLDASSNTIPTTTRIRRSRSSKSDGEGVASRWHSDIDVLALTTSRRVSNE